MNQWVMQDEQVEQALGVPLKLAIFFLVDKAAFPAWIVDPEEFALDVDHITFRIEAVQNFDSQLFVLLVAIIDVFLELMRYYLEVAILCATMLEIGY